MSVSRDDGAEYTHKMRCRLEPGLPAVIQIGRSASEEARLNGPSFRIAARIVMTVPYVQPSDLLLYFLQLPNMGWGATWADFVPTTIDKLWPRVRACDHVAP